MGVYFRVIPRRDGTLTTDRTPQREFIRFVLLKPDDMPLDGSRSAPWARQYPL